LRVYLEGFLVKMTKQSVFKFSNLFILILFLFVACSGGERPSKVSYPGEVTPEMQVEFNKINDQYKRKDYQYAFSGFKNFIEKYTYNRLADEAYYKQGKIFFLTGRHKEASTMFSKLAAKTPDPIYNGKAYHMAGYSLYKTKDYQGALAIFKKARPGVMPAKLRLQFYSLVVLSSRQSETEVDFGNYCLLRLYDLYEEFAGKSLQKLRARDIIDYGKIKNYVNVWMKAPLSSSEFPTWFRHYPGSPARAFIDFKMGKVYFTEKKATKARKALSKFLKYYPKNSFAFEARKMLTALGGALAVGGDKADYKVGLILPLSGHFESYGMSVLEGVRCAAGYKNLCEDFSGIELVVRDSGLTPASVRLAVEQLVQQKVVAIIGPLSGSLAVEAGMIANRYQIPIFPITQKKGVMEQGEFIFQVGFLPHQQVDALVSEAFSRGHRSFGVFYPNNNYGKTMSELFVAAVRERGGKITAQTEYNRRSPDPYAEVRKLKKMVGRFDKPTSKVGFDAVFIPDSYRLINALVPAFEFQEITGVALIGTNAWNDPSLSELIQTSYPGSFFVDLYNPKGKGRRVNEFVSKFRSSFGHDPRVLEAYGYDILNIIRALASSKGPKKLQQTLMHAYGIDGVTGLKGFKGDGPVVDSVIIDVK
jgi:ABC-type branched-subunit amino acid transport system substrate-binding protein